MRPILARLGEAGIGGLGGAGVGAALPAEDKKDRLKHALIGAGVGAAGVAGLSGLGLAGKKRFQNSVNQDIARRRKNVTDYFDEAEGPLNRKHDFAAGSIVQKHVSRRERIKSDLDRAYGKTTRRGAINKIKDYQKRYESLYSAEPYDWDINEIANVARERKAMGKAREFMSGLKDTRYDQAKTKLFGGLRKNKGKVSRGDREKLRDLDVEASASRATSLPSNYRDISWLNDQTRDEFKSSGEFRDIFKKVNFDARRQAREKVKAKGYDFKQKWEDYQKQEQKREREWEKQWDDFFNGQRRRGGGYGGGFGGFGGSGLDDALKTFGISKDSMKTKKDLNRAYRNLMKKHHPDLNPDNRAEAEAMSKKVNDAMDKIKGSSWYEKLAILKALEIEKLS